MRNDDFLPNLARHIVCKCKNCIIQGEKYIENVNGKYMSLIVAHRRKTNQSLEGGNYKDVKFNSPLEITAQLEKKKLL